MHDESQEIEAVMIRHRGQCPRHKGHTVDAIFATILLTLFVTLTSIMLVVATTDVSGTLKKEAVERGYAIYDPATGKWQWR